MDDHEVENNYAGIHSQYNTSPDDFLRQRAAAYQAFYENIPIRSTSIPNGPDMLMYRRFRYGNLAEFNVLDTRQYRNNFPANEAERLEPSRSILGFDQERWLFNGLSRSDTVWNFLVQQVVLAQIDRDTGPGVEYSTDQWDGFPACRDRLFPHTRHTASKTPLC